MDLQRNQRGNCICLGETEPCKQHLTRSTPCYMLEYSFLGNKALLCHNLDFFDIQDELQLKGNIIQTIYSCSFNDYKITSITGSTAASNCPRRTNACNTSKGGQRVCDNTLLSRRTWIVCYTRILTNFSHASKLWWTVSV